ncbi:mycothiol synthase [Gulosibacter bifidus]|uniref:Mycothiol acetyltransferase n=1 Tax=Gulosibacter bifidus TaxID=272239 RepID=A0ABW5RI18_9MICO|nr:mycothiol synthase [Gulosibacter bifidus]
MDVRELPIAASLAAEVAALSAACAAVDGTEPFNEASRLALDARHAFAVRDAAGTLAGLALCAQPTASTDTIEIEFAVHPDHRRRGHGRALLDALRQLGPATPVFWAHGNLPGAQALAAGSDAVAIRTLYILSRPVQDADRMALREVHAPAGVRIRTFNPERDADAWVASNAKIFASHPEQGKLTRADLDARMQQPWFDAEHFFIAEAITSDADALESNAAAPLLGYCWCKITADEAEIYVLGTDPAASGRGIGSALMRAGLAKIAELGFAESLLYVDGENTRAVDLYRNLGYSERFVDVQYRC